MLIEEFLEELSQIDNSLEYSVNQTPENKENYVSFDIKFEKEILTFINKVYFLMLDNRSTNKPFHGKIQSFETKIKIEFGSEFIDFIESHESNVIQNELIDIFREKTPANKTKFR